MKKIFLITYLILIPIFCFGQRRDFIPFEKNDIRLGLKLPHFNHLSLNPNGKFRENRFGFNGYGIGIEYSYRKNRFLDVSLSFAATVEWIIPVPTTREHNKALFSYYLSITDNLVWNRFTFGYGINYSVNHWREWFRDLGTWGLPFYDETFYSNKTLGVTLNAYYRVGRTLNVGIIYRPSFINLNNGFEPIYEHLISLELKWRIRLGNIR